MVQHENIVSLQTKAICVCKYKTEVSFPISQYTGKSDDGMLKQVNIRGSRPPKMGSRCLTDILECV